MNKNLLTVFTGFAVLSLIVSMPSFALADKGRDNHGSRVSEVARDNSGPGNANDVLRIAIDNRGRDHDEDDDRDEDARIRLEDEDIRVRAEGILPRNVDALIQVLQQLVVRLQVRLNELIALRGGSVAAPVISGVTATEIKATEAKIVWITDKLADSKLFFSAVSPVDVSTAMIRSKGAMELNHRVSLDGLTPNTTYFFIVQSTDAFGNVSRSTQSSFMTLAAPPAPLPLVTLTAMINGANEVPATTSTATGTGTFVLDRDNNTLSFNISFVGLSSAETGAHIHGPADAGANAGILFALPAGSPKTGVWNYGLMPNPETIEADIMAGRTYVNIHSTNFPAGEIRGQIVR